MSVMGRALVYKPEDESPISSPHLQSKKPLISLELLEPQCKLWRRQNQVARPTTPFLPKISIAPTYHEVPETSRKTIRPPPTQSRPASVGSSMQQAPRTAKDMARRLFRQAQTISTASVPTHTEKETTHPSNLGPRPETQQLSTSPGRSNTQQWQDGNARLFSKSLGTAPRGCMLAMWGGHMQCRKGVVT